MRPQGGNDARQDAGQQRVAERWTTQYNQEQHRQGEIGALVFEAWRCPPPFGV